MYDILIKNGYIVDGTGREGFVGDVGIVGENIAYIGKTCQDGKKIIDAKGKVIAPGFIDSHNHVDENIFFANANRSYLAQGVTTNICGNCGTSFVPIGEVWISFTENLVKSKNVQPPYYQLIQLQNSSKEMLKEYENITGINMNFQNAKDYKIALENLGIGTNLYPLVGHGTLRAFIMGKDILRKADIKEIEAMKIKLEELMKDGFRGMSSGLDYPPGAYADTQELIELCKVVAKYKGIYTTHVRAKTVYIGGDGYDNMVFGINEAIKIAKESKVKLQISHINYGDAKGSELKDILDDAIKKGVDLSCDVFTSGSCGGIGYTYLVAFMRPWYLSSGSMEQLIKNLNDKDYVNMVIRDMKTSPWFIADEERMVTLPISLNILKCNEERFAYRVIGDIMEEYGWSLQEAYINILKSDPYTRVRFGKKDEHDDIEKIDFWLDCEYCMPCSDSAAANEDSESGYKCPLNALPHKNSFNIFIKYLSKFARATKEDTIRKATGLVAEKFGINDRGILKEGYKADVIIIDWDTLDLNEDKDDTRRFPKGIETVIVNGSLAIEEYKFLNPLNGKLLFNS